MGLAIEIADPATEADHDVVFKPLVAFNEKRVAANYEPFAIRLRDETSGENVGGLFARLFYDWLFIELFFVPEEARGRGVGSDLIARAEAFARSKGCIGVWLDTFSFQAPEFYRKKGYACFATIDDYPRGGRRLFFQKRLDT